ncbi:hypothetical protein I4U23_004782 [Adineta vaga]|nr:hypothetical protein I4U23_004782 [Adineta vaga]
MLDQLFLLFFIFLSISCQTIYDTADDNAHGLRISGNDQFIVYAVNRDKGYALSYTPFTPAERCSYWNPTRDFYVYSLDVLYNTDNRTSNYLFTFVQIAEQTSTQNVYFSIITMNTSNCNRITGNIVIRDTLIWNGTHQEYMLLKVVPSQKYAYVFADSFVLMFDIIQNRIIDLKQSTNFYTFSTKVIPHAIDLTETWALVTSYALATMNTNIASPVISLCSLNPLRVITSTALIDSLVQTAALATTYNLDSHMSISINKELQMAIVGVPILSAVFLFHVNATNINTSQWQLERTRVNQGPRNVGFGQSVAWINDNTVAVVLLSINSRSWSKSEVWTFSIDSSFEIPEYVFPNNQQTLSFYTTARFYQILSWSNHLYILTDLYRIVFIPSSPAGYLSVWAETRDVFVFVFNYSSCSPGTYKNENGFEFCKLCPPQTKNPAYQPCRECYTCSPTSFCPLGSINEVSYENYSSHIQTYAYPDSPDMNNYDDILVQNIFSIGSSARCLLISPLFWTIIAMCLCCVVWLLMAIGKFVPWQTLTRHRTNAKKFLKNTDIVGEGERWVGGLFSFAIVVLFGFTFWFAEDYINLYPIETSSSPQASCDQTMRNAVFDNALQLPLSNTDGSRWAIFDMLDSQQFTMAIDFINTAASCQNITVQQNRPGVNYLKLGNVSCEIQPDNVTVSASFPLPSHQLTVQVNVSGSYSIGGFRLCLRGSGLVDGVNTLQKLDMCKLFFTENETLSRTATISVVLVKVVNQTKPLTVGDDTYFSGRWTPTFGEYSISDKLSYNQDGEYLRYVNERTIFTITMSEQPFFLQNNQKPIARIAELAFHTLLFCTLIIELFAMAFLLFKLICMPLIRLILRCRHQKKQTSSILPSRNSHEKRKQQSSISTIDLHRLLQHYERKKQRQKKDRLSIIPNESSRMDHQRTAV